MPGRTAKTELLFLQTVGVADNVCFWVGLPEDPVTPRRNIGPHLEQTKVEEDNMVSTRLFTKTGNKA